MTELDVDIAIGGITAITVPDTATSEVIAAGRARLVGWSLRATGSQGGHAAEATVAAPAADTNIVTIGLPQGVWQLSWDVEVGGTTGAPEVNNFQIWDGVFTYIVSVNGSVAGQPYPQPPITVQAGALGTNFSIRNLAAGTVGSTYTASLAASPVGSLAVAEITSGGNQIAEISIPVGTSDTHVLTNRGIAAQSDLTLTMLAGTMRGAVYAILE